MSKHLLPAFLVPIAVMMASGSSKAITPALTTTNSAISSNGSWTLGWEFNVNRPLTVDALGIFDWNTLGLNGSYELGLWSASGTLLASTSVSGMGDAVKDEFVWKNLSSLVTLTPGNYVVAAAGAYGANDDSYAFNGTSTTISGVTFIQSRYSAGSALSYPGLTGDPDGYFGGNFSEVPGPLPVMGAAAAFRVSRVLRRRISLLNTSNPSLS